MFFYVFFEKSIFSRFPFLQYTRLNDLKFEIPKIFWGGAHRAPSPDPSPTLSQALPSIRASPSNLKRFVPSIRASPDSDPQLLKHGCALVQMGLILALFKKGLIIALGVALQCRIYIISNVHKAYDYSGSFVVFWVHMT